MAKAILVGGNDDGRVLDVTDYDRLFIHREIRYRGPIISHEYREDKSAFDGGYRVFELWDTHVY